MSTRTSDSIRTPARRAAAARQTADRRTRLRLRELCDEVLASFRLAKGDDVFGAGARDEARALLAQLTPAAARLAR